MFGDNLVRKINTGYQITLPQDFRKRHHLDVGSMVSLRSSGDQLIVEPFKNRSEALKRLEVLFKDAPKDFASISERQISDMVGGEIQIARTRRAKQ